MPTDTQSDLAFRALADPARRALLSRIASRPHTLSELAEPLPVSLAAVVQQVQLLEAGGLVETRKSGRIRTCYLREEGLAPVEQWLSDRRTSWARRLDRLDDLLDQRAGQPKDVPS